MPSQQYASPFPKLHLSTEEREMLTRTANDLVKQAQEKYEWFLWQERERLDSDRWQFVRTRDDMTVYVDRRVAKSKDNRNMQLLLTTGSMPGTLHDAMYGTLNPSTAELKLKTAYIQDTLLDCATLETILEPTPDLPFQSLSLKWAVKGMSVAVRAMNKKNSDFVSIESTGTRQLYDGQQIGYLLLHSVILAETPPLPQYERKNLSMCLIWRQMTPKLVQAYMTSYVEMCDSMALPMQVKSIADAFAAQAKTVHCGKMKKLAWYVARKASAMEMDEKISANTGTGKRGCSVCGFMCPSVFKCCAACAKPTCRRCQAKHDLFTLGPQLELIKTSVRVCQPCMKVVEELDSGVVAQHEATEREQQRTGNKSSIKVALGRDERASTASSVESTSTESGLY